MKNKKLLLFVLASSFLVASCNNAKPSENVSVYDSTVETSTDTTGSSEQSYTADETSSSSSSAKAEKTFTSQSEWTAQDIKDVNDMLGLATLTDLPYIKNYEYYIEEDSLYPNSLFLVAYTTKEEAKAYRDKLASTYTYIETVVEDGTTFYCYMSGKNVYIDCYDEYDSDVKEYIFVANIYYLDDSEGGGSGSSGGDEKVDVDPSIPEDTDGTGLKAINLASAKNVKTVLDLANYENGMPTTGTPSALVIPVEFSDYKADTLGYTIEKLEKAFNGANEETDFYSVDNYFKEASYGKLDINFDIQDTWFTASKSWAEYEKMFAGTDTPTDIYGQSGKDSYASTEQIILNDALKDLSNKGVDLSQYDTNKDGNIDSVVLVYTAPINPKAEGLGWAWRYWNLLADPSSKDHDYYIYNGVNANDYLWCSYEFLFETADGSAFTNKNGMNTNTFIHEYSHVLGIDDYYDTEGEHNPLEGDIMTSTAMDHNPYSKMILGWITDSKLITTRTEVTVTLDAFETSGDTFIISNNWDDDLGAFQQYWVFSYYTGTGLNAGVSGNGALGSEKGLACYKVNSSLSSEKEDGVDYYFIVNNNSTYTDEDGYGSKDTLIEWVNESNPVYTVGQTVGSDNDDNGNAMPYTIEVVSENEGKLTVKITYNVAE